MSKKILMEQMILRPFARKPEQMPPVMKKIYNQLTQPLEPLNFKLQDLDEQKMKSNIKLGNTAHLPFQIERSNTGNLPIYTEYKHKRTQKFTILRKVTGDVHALQQELKKVTSNSTIQLKAGNILITGIHRQALSLYLHRLGF